MHQLDSLSMVENTEVTGDNSSIISTTYRVHSHNKNIKIHHTKINIQSFFHSESKVVN